MSELKAQFSVLKQTADPAVADAIARLIENGEDHELNRVNVLEFAKTNGLDEEQAISGFLHASRLGLFDLTWNVLCPGCSGVLDAYDTLKSLRSVLGPAVSSHAFDHCARLLPELASSARSRSASVALPQPCSAR